MPITLNHRALSALAKAVSGDMRHTDKLQAFAGALGYASTAAMMAAARADTPLAEGPKNPGPDALESLSRKGDAVFATVRTDDGRHHVILDARHWLAGLTEAQVAALIGDDFDDGPGCYPFLTHMLGRDEEVARIGRYSDTEDIGVTITFDGGQVLSWIMRHRPDLHDSLEAMVENGDLDADLDALKGDLVDYKATVLIKVRCLVGPEDLDSDDVDSDGNDMIAGVYAFLGQSDAPVSAGVFCEGALDEFHGKFAIGNLDNYHIQAWVTAASNVPEEAVDGGDFWVEAPEYRAEGPETEEGPSGWLALA